MTSPRCLTNTTVERVDNRKYSEIDSVTAFSAPPTTGLEVPDSKSSAPLYALLVGAFAVGMTEFVIAGLLPEIAHDFDVSISVAGLLVSGYAVGVVFGAPVLTAMTSRVPRKALLVGVMVFFIAANVAAAVAPAYGPMLVARVASAFCQGVFYGVGSLIATQVARPDRGAAAISMIVSGIAVANVLGIPVGTVIGQHFGWRWAFGAVAALGLAAVVMIAVLIPRGLSSPSERLAAELAVLRRPRLLVSFAVTAFGYGGVAMIVTYVAPLMTDMAGTSSAAVPFALLFFGVGMLAGGPIGGRIGDRNLALTLLGLTVGITVALFGLGLVMSHPVALVGDFTVLGLLGGAILPTAQLNVIRNAAGGENLASSLNVSAVNVGIAAGAAAGGAVIDHVGLSYLGMASALLGVTSTIFCAFMYWFSTSHGGRRVRPLVNGGGK